MPHTVRILLSTFLMFSLTCCSWLIDSAGVTGTQSGIAGVFVDELNTPIAGHRIDIYFDSSATILDSQYTDYEGKFRFDSLQSGIYAIETEYLGKHGRYPEIIFESDDSLAITITSYGWYEYVRYDTLNNKRPDSERFGRLKENSQLHCTNGIDDDFDTFIDCDDRDCSTFCSTDSITLGETASFENSYDQCLDGEDNNSNGYTDCQDDFCQEFCPYRGDILKHDGIDDYSLIPAISGRDFISGILDTIGKAANEYTLEFWFYSMNSDSNKENVTLIQTTDYNKDTDSFLLIQLYPSTLTFSVIFQSHNVQISYSENSWNHFALIYNNGSLELVMNGISQGVEEAHSDSVIVTEKLRTTFIAASPDKTQHYSGSIFDIRTWNIALPISQITGQQHTELVGNEAGLIGYWLGKNKNNRLNTNGAVADYSGHEKLMILGSNLNAIDTNTPTWVMKE